MLKIAPCRALPDNVASILQPSKITRTPSSKVMVTLGPATRSEDVMTEMLKAGVAAARFDLTWGTLSYHLESLSLLQAAAKRTTTLVASCLALSGRSCTVVQSYTLEPNGFPLYDRPIVIEQGQPVIVTAAPDAVLVVPEDPSQPCILPVSSAELSHVAKVGDTVNVERYLVTALEELCCSMEVKQVNGLEVHCVSRDKLNIHGASVVRHLPKVASAVLPRPTPPFTDADRDAMRAFHARDALDFVVLGDLDDPADVDSLRDFLDALGARHTKIIATLQSARSLLNFGAVLQAVDCIVISRGALGLTVLPEKMAVMQKRIVNLCNLIGKPCIVTSILDSMQENPRPTRAEATDVANSVIDGADAFLLGPETVRGRNPVLCVKTVIGICREAETVFDNVGHYDRLMEAFSEPTVDQHSSLWVQNQLVSRGSSVFQPELASNHSSTNGDEGAKGQQQRSRASSPPSDQAHFQKALSAINETISGALNVVQSNVPPPEARDNARDAVADDEDVDDEPPAATQRPDAPQAPSRLSGWPPAHPHPPTSSLRPPSHPGLIAPAEPPPLSRSKPTHVTVAYPNGADPERVAHHQRRTAPHVKFGSYSDLAVESMMRRSTESNNTTQIGERGGMRARVASWGSLATSPADGSPSPSHAVNALPLAQALRPSAPKRAPFLTLTSVEAAASSAVLMADHVKSPLLLVITDTGRTASLVAKYRPEMPVLSLVVPHVVRSGLAWAIEGAAIARQCNLLRGVVPMLAAPSAQSMLPAALQRAVDLGLCTKEDNIVALVRVNTSHAGQTLTVQVMQVGETIASSLAVEAKWLG